MSITRFVCLSFVCPLLALASEGQREPKFTTIDYPGAVATYAAAIHQDGSVLGRWLDASGNYHGFLLSPNGSMVSFDCLGAESTSPNAMNSRFEVVGTYRDADGKWTGFLLEMAVAATWEPAGGRCVPIAPRAAVGRNANVAAIGISEAGEIAGWFDDAQNLWHGYVYRGGVYMTFDMTGGAGTDPLGMSPLAMAPNGELMGHLQPAGQRMRGWFQKGSKLQYLDFPPGDANGMTCGFAMNSKGEIAGHYQRTGDIIRGVHYKDGVYTSFIVPDAKRTDARGINDDGVIVGFYVDANNVAHGFALRWE